MTGFDALLRDLAASPDRLTRATIRTAQRLAQQVAGQARQGAPVDEGRLRNSIEAYVEVHGEEIEGGAKTSYPPAVYHEFGTGPVGEAHGHPMDGALGIARRPDGWVYWSDRAAAGRAPETDGEINGFVYTEGVPARAFLYRALAASEEEIAAALAANVTEVFR